MKKAKTDTQIEQGASLWYSFGKGLQGQLERYLTWRKRRIARRKAKAAAKHPVRDWLESFVWAACVVLIVNQYAFQAYRIPSGSMIPTLLIGDNIFVNKYIYGPELLPGLGKLPGFKEPGRGEIIVFENPDYEGRGALYAIVKRLTYMLTLSLVDIERIQTGEVAQDLFIKRAIGIEGDRLRYHAGEVLVLPAGGSEWVSESEFSEYFSAELGIASGEQGFTAQRVARAEDLPLLQEAIRINVWEQAGLLERGDTAERRSELDAMLELERDEGGVLVRTYDRLQTNTEFTLSSLAVDPGNIVLWQEVAEDLNGWYVPENRVFPLGDNRDDSHDARFFGSVPLSDVLGESALRFWPPARFGNI